jgi:hypothetical protein
VPLPRHDLMVAIHVLGVRFARHPRLLLLLLLLLL